MYYYIKANPVAAEKSGQKDYRLELADGNYILRENDVIQIGYDLGFGIREIDKTIAAIGGIKLTPPQAAQEQDGIECRELPEPTDPQFKVNENKEPAEDAEPTEDEPTAEEGGDA